jgi:hypothetical protein
MLLVKNFSLRRFTNAAGPNGGMGIARYGIS